MAGLRELDLAKAPGVAETIDWTQALVALGCEELDADRGRADAGRGAEVPRGLRHCCATRRCVALLDEARAAAATRMSEALTRHIVTFGRVLREAGLEVGPGRIADALRGLDHVDITRQEDVYWTLRTTLVARREDLEPFDRAFDAWFLRRAGRAPAAPRGDPRDAAQGRPAGAPRRALRPRGGARRRRARQHRPQRRTRSCASKDFAAMTPRGARRGARADRRARRPTRPRGARTGCAAHRRGRRARHAARWRATRSPPAATRSRAASAGAPAAPRKLVVLCDVSGSMEAYSRALLLYLHAVVRSGRGVEVFAFGTRLTRLTPELRTRDPEQALARAAERVVDWAGGTRIGASLKQLQRRLGPARADARRGRADRLRRLGARGPRAGRPRDGAPAPRRLRGRVGQPGQGQPRLPAARRRDARGAAARSTASSPATTSRASRRSGGLLARIDRRHAG